MNMLFLKILTFSIMDHSLSKKNLIKNFLNFISTLQSHNFPNVCTSLLPSPCSHISYDSHHLQTLHPYELLI